MNEFSKSFNKGRARAHTEAEARRNKKSSKIFEVVEPNKGNIVSLRIHMDDPGLYKLLYDNIIKIGKTLTATSSKKGEVITLTFKDPNAAKAFRDTFSS